MNRAALGARSSLSSRERGVSGSVSDDPRLVAALEEYLIQLNTGGPPNRSAFLAEHPEIADELADCLDGLEFIHSAAPRISSPEPSHEVERLAPATQLGDYRILREVGRGGMGIVYEAEQVSLSRRVALKVLPFSAAIDPRQRQRFQVEAQAAAHLHHPHIVPIYSVGCDRGVHYYAMQFIEGRNLASLIRDLGTIDAKASWLEDPSRADASLPSTISVHSDSELPPARLLEPAEPVRGKNDSPTNRGRAFFRTVARLGAQAADGLEHAHGLGVLHRDIKPSNLIVDLRGNLWITDFGLARFEEDAGLTRTGDLLGTLRYMSPEQAQANRVVVDHRTDVYSLGATLYELMTLHTVFDSRDRHELLRLIATEDPIAPRKLDPRIPRDLETIVLKAMAKEPIARYGSAQEMGDDLRRFLADEPILACPPSLLERTARWSRRHRSAVVAAGGIAVLSLVVTIGFLWYDQYRTQVHLEKVQASQHRERELLRTTVDAADKFTMQIFSRLSQAVAGGGGEEMKPLYEDGLRLYEQIVRDSGDDPALRAWKAKALQRVGFFSMVSGRFDRSGKAYKQAISLFEDQLGSLPLYSERHKELAAALKGLGELEVKAHGTKAAEPHYHRSLDIQKKLADRFAQDPHYRVSLIDSQLTWAHHLEREKRVADAARIRWEVTEEYAATAARFASDPVGRMGVISDYFALAMTLDDRSKFDETWRPDVAQVYEQALALDPSYPYSYNNLAWFFAKRIDATPSEARRAVELAERAVALYDQEYPLWNTLGGAYYRAKEWSNARRALHKSMALHNGGDSYDWFLMAMTYHQEGQDEEAMRWYAKALGGFQGPLAQQQDLVRVREEAGDLLETPRAPHEPPHRRGIHLAAPETEPGLLIEKLQVLRPVTFPPGFVCPLSRSS
jgi:serine/threonine protein kinase